MTLGEKVAKCARIVIALVIGTLLSILLLGRMLIATVKTKGKTLKGKRREKPECLTDPSLGEHKFVYLEGIKLHYVISGPEDKPLMLFVHGFPEFWFSWRHQIREFSKHYRVVAVDQRGFNESEKPKGIANYGIKKLTSDIKGLIVALGYDTCILVGHDWGGAVSWSFTMEYPEFVEKLVILNGPHPFYFQEFIKRSWKQFKMSSYIQFYQIPCFPELACQFDDYKMFDRCFNSKTMGLRSGKIPHDVIEAYKYAFSTGGFNGPVNYYRAALWEPDGKQVAKQIECPTLVLWGEKDAALDKELANIPPKYVSNLTVKIIEDASHWLAADKPELVNKYMREFLQEGK